MYTLSLIKALLKDKEPFAAMRVYEENLKN